VDKNLEGSMTKDEETGLAEKDPESLNSSADETELHSSFVDDDDEQSFPDIKSVPSAVLQTNGEFMCSCCGVTMKCARAIKRHISTHMSLQPFRPPTTQSCDETDNTDDVSNEDVTQTELKEQHNVYKNVPLPGVTDDISKRKPESNEDVSMKWRSYPCKDCDRIFAANALLKQHRIQMHKPNQCQQCGVVLAGKWNFSEHVRTEHPGLQICKVQVFAVYTAISSHCCLLLFVVFFGRCIALLCCNTGDKLHRFLWAGYPFYHIAIIVKH